jgi:hypothetical protein
MSPIRVCPRAIICYLLVGGTLLTGCGDGSAPPGEPVGGRLVYQEYGSFNTMRLVRTAPDGSGRTVLWQGTGVFGGLLWPSPDGQQVLFSEGQRWWLQPSNGGAAVPFTPPALEGTVSLTPEWAPDGQSIAWILGDGSSSWRLGIAAVGSATVQLITPDSLLATRVSWSPDGTRLVVCARAPFEQGSRASLYTVSRNGNDFLEITPDVDGIQCNQAWSPDGRLIAYVDEGLWTLLPDGSNRRHLTRDLLPPLGYSQAVFWSPDSRRVIAANVETRQVNMVNVASGALQFYPDLHAPWSNPWSPGGTRLLSIDLIASDPDEPALFRQAVSVTRADGSARVRISPDTVDAYNPAWLTSEGSP